MNLRIKLTLVTLVISYAAVASDAPSPYIGQQQRSIKALSEKEISDLQAGRGMGLSKVAELNHYPGPLHVLELADKLQLSTQQKTETQNAYDHMSRDAKKFGAAIVAKEAELEKLFLQHAADTRKVKKLLDEIADFQGELRFVHVNAHITMANVLSPNQIAMYDELRGYNAPAGTKHLHKHHH